MWRKRIAGTFGLLLVVAPAGCFDFGFEPGDGGGTGAASGSSTGSSAPSASSSTGATSTGASSGGTGGTAPGVCGDGNVDDGEECDDHNLVPGDGCDGKCNEESATGTGGEGGGPATSTGAGAGEQGGGGGADPCPGVDLQNDPENCGVCEFSCGLEACEEGRCGQSVVLDDLGAIKSVLVVGDMLYIEQRTGAEDTFPGTIRTLPVDFDEATLPGLNSPVINAVGGLVLGTVGARHVYFAGQSFTTDDSVFHPNPKVYACDLDDCLAVDLDGIPAQINGMATAGNTLYVLDVSSSWLLASTIDSQSGLPTTATVPLVTDLPDDMYADGVITLQHVNGPSRLYWSTYDFYNNSDGCIFRADVSLLPYDAELPCFTDPFSAQGFIVAADGTIYAQEHVFTAPVHDRVLQISPDGQTMEVFDENATVPRGVDDDFFYTADGTTHAIRAIPREGNGGDAGRTEDYASGPTPYALDATHPDYVFYSVGNTLYRWPKPSP